MLWMDRIPCFEQTFETVLFLLAAPPNGMHTDPLDAAIRIKSTDCRGFLLPGNFT